MLTIENKKKIVAKEDHLLLTEYLNKSKGLKNASREDSILHLVENAELIEDSDFPWEAVRLNSRVIIRDKIARLNYSYTVVMPDLADHKQCRVSVLSEIGCALFGNSRGNDIYWNTPKGKRYFTIMAVSQYHF